MRFAQVRRNCRCRCARPPPNAAALGVQMGKDLVSTAGAVDSDLDGLTDTQEQLLGTDPADPDSDDDLLSDYIEAIQGLTDPLNPWMASM